MKLVKLLFSSWLFVILAACNTNEVATVKVILDSKVPLDSLSSGSGIVYTNSHYYIIGDDSPWLYRVTETMKSLFNYITQGEAAIPAFEIYRFRLPELDGSSAGFSGACMMPGNSSLIFTASVEKTTDVYNDGAIAGSYIGIIPLNGLKDGKFMADLLLEDGEILTKKLEGVAVRNVTDNKYHLLIVTDNDNGTSDLIKAHLIIN